VRHDANFLHGTSTALDEQAQCRIGHHDDELGLLAKLGEHFQLMRCRLESTVCKVCDERLGELLGEGEHVLPVASAEDPELVLQEHDVDVERPSVLAART